MRYLNTVKTIVRRHHGKKYRFYLETETHEYEFSRSHEQINHYWTMAMATIIIFAHPLYKCLQRVECVRADATTPRWARNRTFLLPAPRRVGSDDCTSHASHITVIYAHINQRNQRNRIATDQQCK